MGAGLKEKQKDRHKYFFPGTPRLGLWAVYLRVCSFPGALWWTQLGRDFATLGKRKHVIKRFFGGGVYFRRLKNKVRHLHGSDFKWLKRVCSGVFRPFPMTTQSPAPETTNIDSSLGILPKMIYTHVCKMYVVCVFFFCYLFPNGSIWYHCGKCSRVVKSIDSKSSLPGFKSQLYHILPAWPPIKLFHLSLPQFPLMQNVDYH